VLFDKRQTMLLEYPGGLVGTYAIPGGVTSIGEGAFQDCSGLTNVAIPDCVTGIGASAFQDCSGLTNLTFPDSVTSIGANAFQDCSGLMSAFFRGDAPSADASAFLNDAAVVYYLPGATGWGATEGGLPAVLWNPLIEASGSSFGFSNNLFGFNITGTSNIPIVVEACTNLASPVWTPLENLILTNGLFYFSEPADTNTSGRFYRISSP
jgi:hypothetical protein